MTPKEERDIREFIVREDERYKLVRLGFFDDIEKEIATICATISSRGALSLKDWKQLVLESLYKDRKFADFFRNNIHSPYVEQVVKAILLSYIKKSFSSSERTDVDKYLALDGDTLSFSLSPETFDYLFSTYYLRASDFENSLQLESFSKGVIEREYPLLERYILDELEKNNNYFWEKLYLKLKPMVAGFSYQISGLFGDTIHDLWSDTCCVLNTVVIEKRLKQPISAKDIVSYAVGIIKNKNREYLRKRKKNPMVDIESVTYKVTDDSEKNYFDNPSTVPSNFPSQDESIVNYIDITDKEAVNNYMIVVLYNEEHPLHKCLVKGYEEKIKLLFEHYLDDLSYEEMVEKHYGKVSDEELVKISARLRQDVKRVKERLINRFDSIIKRS